MWKLQADHGWKCLAWVTAPNSLNAKLERSGIATYGEMSVETHPIVLPGKSLPLEGDVMAFLRAQITYFSKHAAAEQKTRASNLVPRLFRFGIVAEGDCFYACCLSLTEPNFMTLTKHQQLARISAYRLELKTYFEQTFPGLLNDPDHLRLMQIEVQDRDFTQMGVWGSLDWLFVVASLSGVSFCVIVRNDGKLGHAGPALRIELYPSTLSQPQLAEKWVLVNYMRYHFEPLYVGSVASPKNFRFNLNDASSRWLKILCEGTFSQQQQQGGSARPASLDQKMARDVVEQEVGEV